MRATVLAGGVGAARFLDGLVRVLPPERVTVVGNVADDLELLGLHVSPDLDTVLYTLAGIVEPERGWGRAGDTAHALEVVSKLGGPDWFHLSDRDLGLHLARSERLRAGVPLSRIARDLCATFGVRARLLPATDDRLRTIVSTPAGELDFQTYFVRRRHQDDVLAVRYEGAGTARPAPGVLEALATADVLLVAPSNPFLSIDPILAVAGVRDTIAGRAAPTVAVTPIVAGRAVKGPADRLLRALAGESSPRAVAAHYAGLITHMLIDEADRELVPAIETLGLRVAAAPTLMTDTAARERAARAALELAAR